MRPEYQLSSQLQLVETNVIVKGEKEFTEKYLVAHRIFRITGLTQQDKLPQILPQNWSSGDATCDCWLWTSSEYMDHEDHMVSCTNDNISTSGSEISMYLLPFPPTLLLSLFAILVSNLKLVE